MKRRTYLVACSSSLALGGCLNQSGESSTNTNSTVKIKNKKIEINNRYCLGDKEKSHGASISHEKNQISINGVIETHKPCLELTIVPIQNKMKNGKVTKDLDIDIDILSSEDTECKKCRSIIDYEAIINFHKLPSSINVYHIERNFEEEKTVRIGPLSEESIQ